MKKLVLFVFGIILFASCSKDQKVVNQLEGTWKETSRNVNGVAQTPSNATYAFEKCKVSKSDCNGTISEDGKSFPFTYSISDKGKTVKININVLGFVDSSTGTIVEHTSSKFIYSYTDIGTTTEVTLAKQ